MTRAKICRISWTLAPWNEYIPVTSCGKELTSVSPINEKENVFCGRCGGERLIDTKPTDPDSICVWKRFKGCLVRSCDQMVVQNLYGDKHCGHCKRDILLEESCQA